MRPWSMNKNSHLRELEKRMNKRTEAGGGGETEQANEKREEKKPGGNSRERKGNCPAKILHHSRENPDRLFRGLSVRRSAKKQFLQIKIMLPSAIWGPHYLSRNSYPPAVKGQGANIKTAQIYHQYSPENENFIFSLVPAHYQPEQSSFLGTGPWHRGINPHLPRYFTHTLHFGIANGS